MGVSNGDKGTIAFASRGVAPGRDEFDRGALSISLPVPGSLCTAVTRSCRPAFNLAANGPSLRIYRPEVSGNFRGRGSTISENRKTSRMFGLRAVSGRERRHGSSAIGAGSMLTRPARNSFVAVAKQLAMMKAANGDLACARLGAFRRRTGGGHADGPSLPGARNGRRFGLNQRPSGGCWLRPWQSDWESQGG